MRSVTDILYSLFAQVKHALTAGNAHNIHSPYVYDLYTKVIAERGEYYCFEDIEKLRQTLHTAPVPIVIDDYGTGKNRTEKLNTLVKRAAKPAAEAQLLFRLIQYFKPTTIVELGTHVGISSCYIASACKSAQLHTIEGSAKLSEVAQLNFKRLQLTNVTPHIGTFDDVLPQLIHTLRTIDVAYIDGNHAYEPTLLYYQWLQPHCKVLVFDDIHWSKAMNTAWNHIVNDSHIKIAIDLFHVGIIIFRPETKYSEYYTLK
jgi:predicted O-methyltransferase YrrM